jgi:hypothetical protein
MAVYKSNCRFFKVKQNYGASLGGTFLIIPFVIPHANCGNIILTLDSKLLLHRCLIKPGICLGLAFNVM